MLWSTMLKGGWRHARGASAAESHLEPVAAESDEEMGDYPPMRASRRGPVLEGKERNLIEDETTNTRQQVDKHSTKRIYCLSYSRN